MANFTPQEIEEILQQFFDVAGKRQYIGARYVPVFGRKGETSIEWDNSKPYEPLTIVTYQGNSYTSRTYVPVGVAIDNVDFWALTGNYNAQVESYRQETVAAKAQVDATDAIIPKSSFSSTNTVKKYIDDNIAEVTEGQSTTNSLLPSTSFTSENTVKKYIDDAIASVDESISASNALLPSYEFSSTNTVKDYVDTKINDVVNKYALKRVYMSVADMIADSTLEIGDTVLTLTNSGSEYTDNIFTISSTAPIGEIAKSYGVKVLTNGLYAVLINTHSKFLPTPAEIQTVNAMANVGCSYTAVKDALSYGAVDLSWSNHNISCSVLTALVLMGIPYDASPYVGASKFNVGQCGYGYSFMNNLPSSQSEIHYSSAHILAQYAASNGFGYIPDSNMSNVCAGDVLFFTDDAHGSDNYFMRISHCEVLLSFDSKSDREKPQPQYTVINGGFDSGIPVRFYTRTPPSYSSQQLVYAARFPLGCSIPNNPKQRVAVPDAHQKYEFPFPIGYDTERPHLLSVCGEVIPTSDSQCNVRLCDYNGTSKSSSGFYKYDGVKQQFFFTRVVAGATSEFNVVVENGEICNVTYVYDEICTHIEKTNFYLFASTIPDMTTFINQLKLLGCFDYPNTFIVRLSENPTFLPHGQGIGYYEITTVQYRLFIRKIDAGSTIYESCISVSTGTETHYRTISYTANS